MQGDRIIDFYELFGLDREWDTTRLGVEISRKAETKGEIGEVAYGILSDESNRGWYDVRLDGSGYGRIPFLMLKSRATFGDEKHLPSNPGMPVWPDGDVRNQMPPMPPGGPGGPPHPGHPQAHPHQSPPPGAFPGQMPPTANPFPTANPYSQPVNPYKQNPYQQTPVGGPMAHHPGMAPGVIPNVTRNVDAGARLGTRIADFFIYFFTVGTVTAVLPGFGGLLALAAAPFWMAGFTAGAGGSPAKLLFGQRVVDNDTGKNLTFGKALARESWLFSQLLAFFPVLIFMGTIGASISGSSDNRGYHDKWANSRVTKKDNPEIQGNS